MVCTFADLEVSATEAALPETRGDREGFVCFFHCPDGHRSLLHQSHLGKLTPRAPSTAGLASGPGPYVQRTPERCCSPTPLLHIPCPPDSVLEPPWLYRASLRIPRPARRDESTLARDCGPCPDSTGPPITVPVLPGVLSWL